MMKHILFTGALFITSAMTGEAMAVCDGTQVTDVSAPTLSGLLTGNSMCQTSPEVAQEQHIGGGVLQDYKLGPASPTNQVDPTTTIGSWGVAGSGADTTVTYTYGSDSYNYKVFLASGTLGVTGSTYEFCTNGVLKATATWRPGVGDTGSYAPVCP